MFWVGKPRAKVMKMASRVAWVRMTCIEMTKSLLCCYRFSYPTPESADFLLATRWNPDFRRTFQGSEYSIWATNHWKVSRKSGFHLLLLFPKSSFGEHSLWQNAVLGTVLACATWLRCNGWPGRAFTQHNTTTLTRFQLWIVHRLAIDDIPTRNAMRSKSTSVEDAISARLLGWVVGWSSVLTFTNAINTSTKLTSQMVAYLCEWVDVGIILNVQSLH